MSQPLPQTRLFRIALLSLVIVLAALATMAAHAARPAPAAAPRPAPAAVPAAPAAQAASFGLAVHRVVSAAAIPAPQPVPTAPSTTMSLAARSANAASYASPFSRPASSVLVFLALALVVTVLAAGRTSRQPRQSLRVAPCQ